MVQCQKMAVTVTPKTWKEIELRMLCITLQEPILKLCGSNSRVQWEGFHFTEK